ncbi:MULTISPECIES: nuclear transport factor 2 family protein [Bacillus]|uniref:RNAse H n=2 Tax=Bacillus TaxID=1386 RepID=A0A0M4FGW3_9BACI|nr:MULTISPECIES: DUF4440 domain-containing protein [Bacillus]ALC80179.1 RNAse H [Bacillus gobiensis]MBP1082844.1 hypothetical protein [Bacillus capparidis]MED1098484.1 DUF4440 domain-containing protein [Bacillus capparidis]
MELESVRETLHDLEKKLLTPETRTSPEEISLLLADEFFEFGSSGTVFVKKDCIGEGGLGVRKMTLFSFEIKLLAPNVVLTTYRVNDEIRKQQTLRSSIWKYIDDRWQMVFHQGTPTTT